MANTEWVACIQTTISHYVRVVTDGGKPTEEEVYEADSCGENQFNQWVDDVTIISVDSSGT